MHRRISRIHPALKHGGYTATSVLPGESQAAFEKLHRNLKAELSPSGALEDDIVMTMARLVWRKQNLMTLHIAACAQDHLDTVRYETSVPSEQIEIEEERQAVVKQAQNELGDTGELTEIGEAATFEGLEKELAVRERLDSAIARCLKQLLLVRGVKSISAVPSSASPKRVTGPSKAA